MFNFILRKTAKIIVIVNKPAILFGFQLFLIYID